MNAPNALQPATLFPLFPGGLHLDKHADSNQSQIVPSSLPSHLVIPLQQHIGEPGKPVVAVGDRVLKGQVIAHCDSVNCTTPVSAAIHAASSGRVVAIAPHAVPHPSGLEATCIIIETDGLDTWAAANPVANCATVSPETLRQLIAQAGIVGLGGAGFPSHLKLNPGELHTLILNGAECEPYITCDDALMRERPEQIVLGARILAHALGGIKRCIIAVEDNKPEAYAALKAVADSGLAQYQIAAEQLDIVQVPTRYPMGGEQQLIKVLTGQALPRQRLPRSLGIVMHNVGTAAAIYQAVKIGRPLISRIITLTGDALASRQNMEVPLGTPIAHLLAQCGVSDQLTRLVMGGPMMGFSLSHAELPVVKTTNCLIASTPASIAQTPDTLPCIRCGACEQACPALLLPQQLYWHARAKDFEKALAHNLFECIECGCCAYVCPSQIPLVQYYRYAKSEIRRQLQEQGKSTLARRRHEFRSFRLEREKTERQARHQAKAAPSPATAAENSDLDPKKAAIAAALERAQAKKAAKVVSDQPPE